MQMFKKINEQQEKEYYISDMLYRTLYCNEVNIEECENIINIFIKKTLGENYYVEKE